MTWLGNRRRAHTRSKKLIREIEAGPDLREMQA